MFSHFCIGVSDLERAVAFYSPVLGELGLEMKFHDADRAWCGWRIPGTERPLLIVGRPQDEREASPGNGQMIALAANSRDAVNRAYDTAMAAGGATEGEPGLRPEYHDHFYGAYFRDPEGNKVCVCCHDPVPGNARMGEASP